VTLILSILFATACSNVSFSDDAQNNEKSVEKISFDLTYQELLQKIIDNNFQFSEIIVGKTQQKTTPIGVFFCWLFLFNLIQIFLVSGRLLSD
jgi:hypothetical protein